MRLKALIFIMVLFITLPLQAADDKGYYLLSAEKIARIIDAGRNDGRRIVFVYTSWCPYCRIALPKIIDIAKKKQGSVIAISVDKDPDTFKRYIQTKYGDVPFHPIVWDRKAGDLGNALSRFGIELGNGIPFTALLDEYGYMHKQGVIKPEESEEYVLGKSRPQIEDVINQ